MSGRPTTSEPPPPPGGDPTPPPPGPSNPGAGGKGKGKGNRGSGRGRGKGRGGGNSGSINPGPQPKVGHGIVILDATTANEPQADRHVSVNITRLTRVLFEILQYYRAIPKIEQRIAMKNIAAFPHDLDRLVRLFIGAGLITQAQVLVSTARVSRRTVGKASVAMRSTHRHLRCVQLLVNQCGIYQDYQVGETILYVDVPEQAVKLLRAANQLAFGFTAAPYNLPEHDIDGMLEELAKSWWLPCSQEDKHLDAVMRILVQRWLHQNGFEWIRIPQDLVVLTGAHPAWWLAIPAGQRGHLAPVFAARPANAAGWLAWANTFTAQALILLGADQGVAAGTFVAEDLRFGDDHKPWMNMTDSWARINSGILGESQCTNLDDAPPAGSSAQMGIATQEGSGFVVFHAPWKVEPEDAQLWSLVDMELLVFGGSTIERNFRWSGARRRAEALRQFVERDV